MPELVRASRDRARRDRAKEALLAATMGGVAATRLAEHGEVYAGQVEARQLRPDTVARLRWHRDKGHECVIVSASLAAYVRPLSRRLGLGEPLATELEVGPDGLLTGRLAGANCRAGEKVARLEAAFGDRPIAWAYGDSVDDEVLLARAAHPLLVGRSPVAAAGG
jgi:phosphatidylglycerophosphatase C